MKCLVVSFLVHFPPSWQHFLVNIEYPYLFQSLWKGSRISSLAVWAVLWSCAQGPGWKCIESGLDCTIPPPPAASSAELLQNRQPTRSSAAFRQNIIMAGTKQTTWTKLSQQNMTASFPTMSKSCWLTRDRPRPRPPLVCNPTRESETKKKVL